MRLDLNETAKVRWKENEGSAMLHRSVKEARLVVYLKVHPEINKKFGGNNERKAA